MFDHMTVCNLYIRNENQAKSSRREQWQSTYLCITAEITPRPRLK